ncbi:uncharacterized protein [Amphiura filiformis]|uniref:uncharacterized protein n=1 Tax=Amphiura filiformis TaxID=82378 RepID=UPI003B21FB7D
MPHQSSRLLPCSFRGVLILHGDKLDIDACTTCSCDNQKVRCEIKTCGPTFCDEPIVDPDECCDFCPHDSQSSTSTTSPLLLSSVPHSSSQLPGDRVTTLMSPTSRLLPCSYRGEIILHGDQLYINECTTCSCDNNTVKCDIKSCQPTFCDEPIGDPAECCDLCPYDVLVYRLDAIVTELDVNTPIYTYTIDLKLSLNKKAQAVKGEGLWKISAWMSPDLTEDGMLGYVDQVLTGAQASTGLIRPSYYSRFGGFTSTLSDIEYIFNTSGIRPESMSYLCLHFGLGNNPEPEYPQIPFTLLGVRSVDDDTPNPDALTVCKHLADSQNSTSTTSPLLLSSGPHSSSQSPGDRVTTLVPPQSSASTSKLLPCSFRGRLILHGDQLYIDECTTCNCDNSTVKCDIKSCRPTFCDEPIVDPDECCDICPYDVLVYRLDATVAELDVSTPIYTYTIDLQLSLNEKAQGVEGAGLWKVSAWMSPDPTEDRMLGYMDQVQFV